VPRVRSPPSFLRVASHPLRWAILSELTGSDLRVRELTDAVGQPQNLVSYHLARLRTEGLVTSRRSSFDGRDAYYRVDLERCGHLMAAAGAALHPGLELRIPAAAPSIGIARVLFLCTGNSARSQIAEALLNDLATGVHAWSAGSHPKPLHPNAVRVMRERGIDIAGRETKHLDRFAGERFDYVVTLCDRVREVCPEFPDRPRQAHWSLPDPAREGATDDETYPAFERTALELESRVRFLAHVLAAPSTSPEMN
jgi:ArsR family transcriptional regulator, arsenate/arsenite/antimonite-responsive transcriptional repressor / arsenate reductase (thioredoxin)